MIALLPPRDHTRWIFVAFQSGYHPETLKETLKLLAMSGSWCVSLKSVEVVGGKRRNHFLLACLLGISHHQRPGFLSFPSSHLVPYLRSKKFPRDDFPEMYEYRSVEPRIRAKVARALKRHEKIDKSLVVGIQRSPVELLTPPRAANCFITSPPYMNALDYERDNRLRNWFLLGGAQERVDTRLSDAAEFRRMMSRYARILAATLVKGGQCVFVVGEKTQRNDVRFPSEVISEVIDEFAPSLRIKEIISDRIPDIRRSRRHLSGVKMEHVLVYERRR